MKAKVKVKETKSENRRMPVWALIITDIVMTGVCLGIFTFYHLVLPRAMTNGETVIISAEDTEDMFTLPGNSVEDNFTEHSSTSSKEKASSDSTEDKNTAVSSEDIATGGVKQSNEDSSTARSEKQKSTLSSGRNKEKNYGNTNTMDIASDTSDHSMLTAERSITKVNSYRSDKLEFVTNKIEVGEGSNKITYYLSDVYVTNVKYIMTAFAKGKFGKNLREKTLSMAKDNQALLAISGDFYGNGETGIVIRNGVLYRSVENDADVCVLYTDGTMETYSPEDFDADEVLKKGAWQAWTFGPQLLDGTGNILSVFNTTTFLNSRNPRCAIGYVEPGHYVFLVVDGREEGYSKGVTLSELALLLKEAGCLTAYNLDGGKSAAMVYQEEYVSKPCEGGRTISDIIYVGE